MEVSYYTFDANELNDFSGKSDKGAKVVCKIWTDGRVVLCAGGDENDIELYGSSTMVKWIVNIPADTRVSFSWLMFHAQQITNSVLSFLFLLQYYEMSYGLNVEMHKQVSWRFVT